MALSRRIVNSITKILDRQRYMKHLTAYVGFNRTYLSYRPVLRDVSLRRRSLLAAVNAAVGTIVSNLTMPLRLVSLVGVTASFVSVRAHIQRLIDGLEGMCTKRFVHISTADVGEESPNLAEVGSVGTEASGHHGSVIASSRFRSSGETRSVTRFRRRSVRSLKS